MAYIRGNFTGNAQESVYMSLKLFILRIQRHLPGATWGKRRALTVTPWWARCRFKSLASWLFAQLFRLRSKKTSKLRVSGLCEENPSPSSHTIWLSLWSICITTYPKEFSLTKIILLEFKCHWRLFLLATANRVYMSMEILQYSDVIITGVSTVCSTVCSGIDQRKYQSSAPLASVRGIHWWPVDSHHKGPVTRKKRFHLMTSSHLSYTYI